ncbi:hypothetical protein G6F38_003329 [Rhizopus arrhizus]|nr:hypothetical protein G6F38_003329 [Rhizopus arrhizus]
MTEQMSPREEFEAKRWFAVGAYQAGATDKVISDMIGLSTASVHNIITQFKKTGSPVCSRHGYDENGHLIDSDDELERNKFTKNKVKKTRPRRPSAKDLVTYVLNKAQESQKEEHSDGGIIEPNINIKQEDEEDEKHNILFYQNRWRPPTPPYSQQQQKRHSFDRTSLLSPPLNNEPKAEHWTAEEDKILMAHLLTRLSSERWPEAVAKLQGKHDIKSCKERWELLRQLLLKGAEKSGTREMPKIISSSVVSSSDHTTQQEQHSKTLYVYYCLCSEFLLVIDADLRQLPRRRTDNSFIVSNVRRTYKLSAEAGDCVLLKRRDGYEKQYRYHCPRCELPVAYEMNEQRKSGAYTYILEGALTDVQGKVPSNALIDIQS